MNICIKHLFESVNPRARERDRHRLSLDGERVDSFAIAGRKHAHVTPRFAAQFGC